MAFTHILMFFCGISFSYSIQCISVMFSPSIDKKYFMFVIKADSFTFLISNFYYKKKKTFEEHS